VVRVGSHTARINDTVKATHDMVLPDGILDTYFVLLWSRMDPSCKQDLERKSMKDSENHG
jgi:hypothetical protein